MGFFNAGKRDPEGFLARLRDDSRRRDEIWVIPEARLTHLDEVCKLDRQNGSRMYYWPEELFSVPGWAKRRRTTRTAPLIARHAPTAWRAAG
jgi:hypothetical protein